MQPLTDTASYNHAPAAADGGFLPSNAICDSIASRYHPARWQWQAASYRRLLPNAV